MTLSMSRWIARAAALAMALPVAGCLTTEALVPMMAPIALAADSPPDRLRAEAEAGQAKQQYAVSLVYRHGLNGEPVDPVKAVVWRVMALAQRGSTSTAIWVPGVEGKPGHVMMTSIPVYGLGSDEAALIDRCVDQLQAYGPAAGPPPPEVEDLCGGHDHYVHLQQLWARAMSVPEERTPASDDRESGIPAPRPR